jgi:hypothetical protein
MATRSNVLEGRGHHIAYREGEANHCPGCGRSHWYVGRVLAECAFCGAALPLDGAGLVAGGQIVRTVRRRLIPDPNYVQAVA